MIGISSSWNEKEDLYLVEKYFEVNGNFTKLKENFLKNRSDQSLRQRYYKLARLAEENHMDIKSYVEKKAEMPKLPEIENVLINENQNSRLLHKITKFSPKEITDAILCVSKNNILLISKLVLNFKYILNNYDDQPALIVEFFNSANEIRVDLFIQQCIMFRLFSYSEIIEKIEYAKEIPFLNSCPILDDFQDRNTKLEKARSIKQNNALKKQLFNERKEFKNTLELSEEKIIQKDLIIEDIQNESQEIKESYAIVLAKENSNQSIQDEITKILNENYLVRKEKLQKYPILILMLNYLNDHSTDEKYYKFCSLLKIMNNYSFQYLHRLVPIYSSTTCYNYTVLLQKNLITMMQQKEYISLILEIFYHGSIEFRDHRPVRPIIINLGGDAASTKPAFESTKNAVYVFEVLPLDSNIRPCVVHMMPTRNGSSTKEVVERYFEIAKYLTEIGFIVKFYSTDGDVSFDTFHIDFFEKHVMQIIDCPFMQIVEAFECNIFLPLSDLLHLLKSARARLVNHPLMIDIENLICVNTQLFNESVNLGPVLEDASQAAAMKDQYALVLFSWNTFILAVENGRFDAASFILPFVYLVEAVRSPLLSVKMRLDFISYAFSLFKYHYQMILKVPANSMFQQRYVSSCLGVLFGDKVFLYRLMNTCIGLSVAIKQNPHNLPLQRLGSHDLELFFAYMRLLSFNDNTYTNAVRVAVRAIIIRKFAIDIGYPMIIKKRENAAGIDLTFEINTQENFDFDGIKLNEGIFQLLKGNDMNQKDIFDIINMINAYTNRILTSKYKVAKVPHIMSGWLPFCRYNILNYALSVLPIPHPKSAFDFYLKSKKTQKRIEKQSIFDWFIRIITKVFENEKTQSLNIPFKYDITNENDRKKLTEYFNHLQVKNTNDEHYSIMPNENDERSDEKNAYSKIKRKRLNDDFEINSYIENEIAFKSGLFTPHEQKQVEKNPPKKSILKSYDSQLGDLSIEQTTENQNENEEKQIESFLSQQSIEQSLADSREIFSHIEGDTEIFDEIEENVGSNCDLKTPLSLQVNWQIDLFKSISLFLYSMREIKSGKNQKLLNDNLLSLISNEKSTEENNDESHDNDDELQIERAINDYSFQVDDPNFDE